MWCVGSEELVECVKGGVTAGEVVRGFGLGFTNLLGTVGVLDVCGAWNGV